MAERRSPERAGRGGWLWMLALGVIGVAAGFATGIVAGVSWEEPALVFSYLTGGTEEIDWGLTGPATDTEEALADRAPEPLPAVAAPPRSAVRQPPDPLARRGAGTEAVGGARTNAARVPDAPPVARDPLPGGEYSVQVGAFSDAQAAHTLADSLRDRGYHVYLSREEGDGAAWRVRVGPLQSREDAERIARRLESREKLPTWILSESS